MRSGTFKTLASPATASISKMKDLITGGKSIPHRESRHFFILLPGAEAGQNPPMSPLLTASPPKRSLVWIIGLLTMIHCLSGEEKPATPELWFYYPTNLQVAENLKPLEAVFRRAAAAGYTKVYLTDSKFCRLETVPQIYFKNAERVKELAAELHLEIVPGIFPIGYSEGLLYHNPNLIESLPVRDALFVVTKGEAHPVADPPVHFPDGGFRDPAQWDWHDPVVHLGDGTAHVSGAQGVNARIMKALTVAPFHQYHITVRIKTLNYNDKPLVLVLSPDTKDSLNHVDLDVKPTQDWKTYHVVFNSLEQTKVLVYFRAGYSGSTGEMWWDQPTIEEAGLLNIVRRDSAPLIVRTEDGKTLTEGKDFEPVADAKMGQVPWPGSYEVWHEPPLLKTALPDGTKLRISFNHAITTDQGKTSICLSDPQSIEILRDQARRVDALFHAKRYFMEHDEIRVMGWDNACAQRHLDSGAILADNIRTCTQIMKEVSPSATLYVWNDMFDPYHNAHDHYYLVKGNLAGSWEGLDSSVVIANWNSDKADKSLPWFANRGHHQLLAGYYDAPPERILNWLKTARNVNHVDAVMYTTWANHYSDLERFAEIVKSFH